jgi:hypothetical protein
MKRELLFATIVISTLGCTLGKSQVGESQGGKIKNVTEGMVYDKFVEWVATTADSSLHVKKKEFKVHLVDVNGDGYLDGMVDFNEFVPENGNAFWYMGYPYFENTDQGLKYICTLDGKNEHFPELKSISYIKSEDGIVYVKAIRFREHEANCCPSIEENEKYMLQDSKFVFAGSAPLENWNFEDLTFVNASCFEGNECTFVFKNERNKIFKYP